MVMVNNILFMYLEENTDKGTIAHIIFDDGTSQPLLNIPCTLSYINMGMGRTISSPKVTNRITEKVNENYFNYFKQYIKKRFNVCT